LRQNAALARLFSRPEGGLQACFELYRSMALKLTWLEWRSVLGITCSDRRSASPQRSWSTRKLFLEFIANQN